jgi:hypothetical protein
MKNLLAEVKCNDRANAYPVTARPMTAKEKRRFQKWKNR